jgi:peptidoglycan/LPS O-acetylase OafA/YrhL
LEHDDLKLTMRIETHECGGEVPLDTSSAKSAIHLPELDGIRGLAILMVFLSHTTTSIGVFPDTAFGGFIYSVLKLGWSGVDLFFVLSGFLITGILIDQRMLLDGEPGRYFGHFYARRALRIFPLYYASLLIVFVMAPLVTGSAPDFRNLIIHGFYLQNIVEGYPMALSHFWSLAVEEHFYLILPLVIYWVRPSQLAWVLWGGVILAICARITLEGSALNVYRFSLTRFDSLLMGSLLALEYRSTRGLQKNSVAFLAASALVLVVLIVSVGDTSNQTTAHRLIGYSLFGLFYISLIRQVIASDDHTKWKSFFKTRFLRWCGKLSYCVYVVHWPVLLVLTKIMPKGMGWPLAALTCTLLTGLASFLIAAVSWRWFESPILSLRRHFAAR